LHPTNAALKRVEVAQFEVALSRKERNVNDELISLRNPAWNCPKKGGDEQVRFNLVRLFLTFD
jgi:hypothetical protein